MKSRWVETLDWRCCHTRSQRSERGHRFREELSCLSSRISRRQQAIQIIHRTGAVRSRRISTNSGDPLVLTLASGAVVTVPQSCVHVAATRWLRNLPSTTTVTPDTASVTKPATSDAAQKEDQDAGRFSSVQFDAKGVDFSGWLRRFVEDIQRNWFVPESAMTAKGHVVVRCRVHKNGAITDLAIVTPSPVNVFNQSAFGALVASSPTAPLPPAYPDESTVFTMTFYFNESPPKDR